MVKEVSDTMDLGVQAQEEKVDMTNVPQELVFGLDMVQEALSVPLDIKIVRMDLLQLPRWRSSMKREQ